MEFSLRCASVLVPFPFNNNKRNRGLLRAQLSDENDPLLRLAINSASLRLQETQRREPLFMDPYAGCLFIDDKLLRTVNHMDGLKQVVLFSDGMDTRPYRLNWPSSTIIFDISPERVYQNAIEKLQDVGAKIPRSCLFLHVPLESSNIQEALHMKGFNGNRPSILAIQGLPLMTLASFKEILLTVSGMAMDGCLFLGELPAWLAETKIGTKSSTEKWMDNLFMSNGFKVNMVSYHKAAKSLGKALELGDHKYILFVAEQLRFSDDQMETWKTESQRVEEDRKGEDFE
ncbi:hypothetical protein GOBAR_DD32424 [Gossypium barbadense]|nr:hypothetical protein GOBAR_DD32424 [Gossypium barbadense]